LPTKNDEMTSKNGSDVYSTNTEPINEMFSGRLHFNGYPQKPIKTSPLKWSHSVVLIGHYLLKVLIGFGQW